MFYYISSLRENLLLLLFGPVFNFPNRFGLVHPPLIHSALTNVIRTPSIIDSISVTSHNYAIYRTTVITHWLPICHTGIRPLMQMLLNATFLKVETQPRILFYSSLEGTI